MVHKAVQSHHVCYRRRCTYFADYCKGVQRLDCTAHQAVAAARSVRDLRLCESSPGLINLENPISFTWKTPERVVRLALAAGLHISHRQRLQAKKTPLEIPAHTSNGSMESTRPSFALLHHHRTCLSEHRLETFEHHARQYSNILIESWTDQQRPQLLDASGKRPTEG